MEIITTQNQKTLAASLRNVYLHPTKKHPQTAFELVQQMDQDMLMSEFNLNHNAMLKLQMFQKEYKYRYSYEKFLLQHIRK